MNHWTAMFAPIVGRILIGGFFVWSGIEKAINFPGFVGFFAGANYPQPLIFALSITALETLGGLALVIDFQTRLCALLLMVYILLSSMILSVPGSAAGVQSFVQDMAILGGLLMVVAYDQYNPARQR